MLRREYPEHWPLRRKLRRLRTIHGAFALLAFVLTLGILERMGGWWALFVGMAFFVGTVKQYQDDHAKILASEAIKNSKA